MLRMITRLSLLLFAASFLVTSCTEDLGGGLDISPSASLITESPFVGSTVTVGAGETFQVKLRAIAGSSQLRSLTVTEDGVKVPVGRLAFAHTSGAANPLLTAGTDKDGFTWEITVTAHEGAATKTYRFEVADEVAQTSTATVEVTTTSGPLSISFVKEAPYFWENANLEPGSRFEVRVQASRGPALLKSVVVLENDTAITDLTRIRKSGTDFTANPLALTGDETKSIDWVISIKSQNGGSSTYAIEVEDQQGNKERVSLDISTGTLVTTLTGKLLLNAAGPT